MEIEDGGVRETRKRIVTHPEMRPPIPGKRSRQRFVAMASDSA
jgi:hypothetical protein